MKKIKRSKKQKKKSVFSSAVIAIIITIILAVAFICISIFSDMKEEKKLNNEIQNINTIMASKKFDKKELEKHLNRTVSNGEYKIIEKAYKDFLRDNQKTIDKIVTFFKNSKSPTILSLANIKGCNKDFTSSIELLDKEKNELQKLKNEYKELNKEQHIMTYIKDKDLSDYYVTYYKNKIAKNVKKTGSEKDLSEEINENLILIDKTKKVIQFLSKNKDLWHVDDKAIYFYNEDLTNQYNKLLEDIKK